MTVDSCLLAPSARVSDHTSGVHFMCKYSHIRAYVRPIKCVCKGQAQPTDIDALVIYAQTRVRSYLQFATHLRDATLILSARHGAYMRVDGVIKYESSFAVHFYVDVHTCPCLEIHTGSANLFVEETPGERLKTSTTTSTSRVLVQHIPRNIYTFCLN